MKHLPHSARRVLLFGILWALSYIVCLFIIRQLKPSEGVGLILSFVPVIAFGLFIFHLIRGMAKIDEVERRIQLEGTVWAFTLGILTLMLLGLIDLVVELPKEDWSYRHLVPFFFLYYLVGILISRRKYRGDEK